MTNEGGATPPATIAQALDQIRADYAIDLADRAASLWRSVAEALWRGDLSIARIHCTQVADVTHEVFHTLKAFGAAEVAQ